MGGKHIKYQGYISEDLGIEYLQDGHLSVI
jgi:hypothetical protein